MMENEEKPLILIVEDNNDNLNYLAKILDENDYDIAVATSKQEALNYLDTPNIQRFDLILLDISLSAHGDTDGFYVCKQFKQSRFGKEIPIIFLSAHEDESYILEAFKEGGVDYISKRSSEKNQLELLARVKTHIDLKRSRDKTESQRKVLEELNATKDMFFRIIAHDLRSPFDAIINNSKCLHNHYSTLIESQKTTLIKNINISSQRVFKLLENLLKWAEIQLKEMKPQLEVIRLKPLIENNLSLLGETIGTKKIIIKNTVSDSCVAFADQDMTDFVIRNLLGNAAKFTAEGGELAVTCSSSGECVEVSISDTGIGMSRERMEKVFQLYKGRATIGTAGEKGTGLGLILCKTFLEFNQGSIHVQSQEGHGSTFTFRLPKRNHKTRR